MKVRLVLLTLIIPAPALTAETRVSVPSDPTAQFFVVGKGDSGSQRTIMFVCFAVETLRMKSTARCAWLAACTSKALSLCKRSIQCAM